MAKSTMRNKEVLKRGNNIFVGNLVDDGDCIILIRNKVGLYPILVSTVDVPRVGKQTFILVEDMENVNEITLKSLVLSIMDAAGIEFSSKITVGTEEASTDPIKREVVGDFNQQLYEEGIDPIKPSEVSDFLKDKGFTISSPITEIEINATAKLSDRPFDPKKTVHEGDSEELLVLNEQATRFIDITNNYVLSNTLKAAQSGVVRNILFTGDAGTGKTSAFYKMCALAGAVPMSFNASTNVDEDFAFGSYVINDDSSIEARYRWLQGMFTKAYKNGYWLLIDEANMIQDGGVLAPMNNAIAPPFKLELPNGESVKMHPNFRLFLAMNIGYNHTYELNQALADRLQRKVRFPDLTVDEAFSRLSTKLGFTNRRIVEKLYDIYTSLKALAINEGIGSVISYRGIEDCIKQATITGDIKDALEGTLFESIYYEVTDQSVVDSAKDSLKSDVSELERLFKGHSSTDKNDFNDFDIFGEAKDELEDEDDLLEALDKI